ncbi:MAG: hypothetical protein OEY61_13460 [Gammaproteobacteria bacterium]|nr:hypothetical protein [Gammaproteobacteria bacterium]
MRTYLVINGKEVTNPVAKFLLFLTALVFSFVSTLLFLFIILPLVGLAVTLSVGLVVSIVFVVFISIPALMIFTALFGRLFGETEFRLRK